MNKVFITAREIQKNKLRKPNKNDWASLLKEDASEEDLLKK